MPRGTGDLRLRTPVQRSQPSHFRIVARLKSGVSRTEQKETDIGTETAPPFSVSVSQPWIPSAAQSGHCPSRRLRLPQGAMQSVQSGLPETWEGRDRVPVRFIQATLL